MKAKSNKSVMDTEILFVTKHRKIKNIIHHFYPRPEIQDRSDSS